MPQIRIDNIQMAYTDSGAGPPVVLLHGYPFNRSLWTEQIEELSEAHRVVVPDLRGFGESDSFVNVATMDRMAQDVVLLMDALGISTAAVGGLSMGGYVALAFYRQFSPRVKSLIVSDTRSQADTEEGKQTREKQARQILAEGMAGIVDSMLPKLLTPETVSKRPELVKRIRDMMLKTKPTGASAALLGMAARSDQTELLARIAVPTLILVGRDDAITPVEDSEKMHRKIKGSSLVVIENAGHVSNLERVDEFNKNLIQFLRA
jgi:pimeloyl-ACP methyl ester carboxylesterase